MMTGQILAGSPPVEAVKYQILIMFLIASGTGFGVMTIDEQNRVTRFDEKPVNPQPVPGNPEVAIFEDRTRGGVVGPQLRTGCRSRDALEASSYQPRLTAHPIAKRV